MIDERIAARDLTLHYIAKARDLALEGAILIVERYPVPITPAGREFLMAFLREAEMATLRAGE